MSDYTENYNLKKPYPNDFFDVNDFNGNADIIDKALASKLDVNSTDNLAKEASVQEVITKVNTNAKETSLQNLIAKIGNYSDEGTSSIFSKLNTIQNNLSQNEKLLFPVYQSTNFYPKAETIELFNIQGSGKLHLFYFQICPGRYNATGTSITAKLIIDDATIFTITATRSDPEGNSGGEYSVYGNFLALDSFYFSYQNAGARYVLKGTTHIETIYSDQLIWKGEINDLVGAGNSPKSYSLVSDKSAIFKNKIIVSVTANTEIASDSLYSTINLGYTLD